MKKITLVLLMMLCFSARAEAFHVPTEVALDNQAASEEYGTRFFGKMGRGLYNLGSAPCEFIAHSFNAAMTDPRYGLGVVEGIAVGTYYGVERLVTGVWDVLSAPFPGYRRPNQHRHESLGSF